MSPLYKSATGVTFWFFMCMNERIENAHCKHVHFQGSNSMEVFTFKNICIAPAASHLELVLFSLWYWPIMNAHTKQQQDKVFETDFIGSQKPTPNDAHLLALSYITNLSYTHTTSLSHVTHVQHHSIPYTHHTVPLRPQSILLTQTLVQIHIHR